VSALTEGGKRSRKKVSWVSGIVVFIAGIPAALSMGVLADFHIFDKTVFDATDYLVSNIMLPLGCLLIAIFISFKMNRTIVEQEFRMANTFPLVYFSTWTFLMKWIVPLTIVVVYLHMLGVI
jgi:NSS family neurotransmitter:Na+ symporter